MRMLTSSNDTAEEYQSRMVHPEDNAKELTVIEETDDSFAPTVVPGLGWFPSILSQDNSICKRNTLRKKVTAQFGTFFQED